MNRHVSIFVILLLSAVPCIGQKLPALAEGIELENRFEKTVTGFSDKTLELRLQYDCFGGFLSGADRALLLAHSRTASEILGEIYLTQEKLRRVIEEYEGDDWDERFGATGFWRSLYNGAADTLRHKCRIDYYYAAALDEGAERDGVIAGIIKICSKPKEQFDPEDMLLMRAKATSLLTDNPKAAEYSLKAIDTILQEYAPPDAAPDRTYFCAAMLKHKLEGKVSILELKTLAAKLKSSKLAVDVELNLELGFLEIRYSPQLSSELLEKYLRTNPEPKYFVAKTILTHLKGLHENKTLARDTLARRTPYELALAFDLVMQTTPADYVEMLDTICGIGEYQRPQVLYAAALGNAEANPLKAIEYYIRASTGHNSLPDPYMKLTAVDIAYEGARLGYRLYERDEKYEQVALRGLAFYCSLAESKADSQLQYLYAVLLGKDGKKDQSRGLLEALWQGGGEYAARAKLDLIIESLGGEDISAAAKKTAVDELAKLLGWIGDSNEKDKEVRPAAAKIYCQLLLDNGDSESAEIVLRFLGRSEDMAPADKARIRSDALRLQKKYIQAAEVLSAVLVKGDCSSVGEAAAILADVIDRIDDFQARAGYPDFVRNCRKLAEYCIECAEAKQKKQLEFVLAELLTLLPKEIDALDKAQILLNTELAAKPAEDEDIDVVRCSARLLTARGEYSTAAGVWSQLSAANAPDAGESPSWYWWRAKFHQLYCWAKFPEITAEQVVHAVEVLKNSHKDIPAVWAQKLTELAQTPKAD